MATETTQRKSCTLLSYSTFETMLDGFSSYYFTALFQGSEIFSSFTFILGLSILQNSVFVLEMDTLAKLLKHNIVHKATNTSESIRKFCMNQPATPPPPPQKKKPKKQNKNKKKKNNTQKYIR